jgi:hypothetical protein
MRHCAADPIRLDCKLLSIHFDDYADLAYSH